MIVMANTIRNEMRLQGSQKAGPPFMDQISDEFLKAKKKSELGLEVSEQAVEILVSESQVHLKRREIQKTSPVLCFIQRWSWDLLRGSGSKEVIVMIGGLTSIMVDALDYFILREIE